MPEPTPGTGQLHAGGTGHPLPNLPLIPAAARQLPMCSTASAATCGPSARDAPGGWGGVLRRGPGPRMLPMGQPGANARLLLASLYFSPALMRMSPTRLSLDEDVPG